ncbi:hypothetical protein B4099_2582 [Heyndrickxia coagulans]|uniref:Uncharacterized protein n=1 Tax=Heyndrickxia coagulans TaxID=1398 RepID=A0A150JP35_HEYCO|nr:hypothetical protein B4099_2582 [Heyndrickxia coagulans]
MRSGKKKRNHHPVSLLFHSKPETQGTLFSKAISPQPAFSKAPVKAVPGKRG